MFQLNSLLLFFLIHVNLIESERFHPCSLYGDPHLSKFSIAATNWHKYRPTIWCDLPESNRALFRNRYVTIDVVNANRSHDVIVNFNIKLYNDLGNLVCTVGPNEFYSANKIQTYGTSGVEVRLSTGRDLSQIVNVIHLRTNLSIFITKKFYRITHYRFDLWTTAKVANASQGMCNEGCPSLIASRSLINSRSQSTNHVTSLLADEVCNTYINELKQTSTGSQSNVDEYARGPREACVIDVRVTGRAQFAEEAIATIVSDLVLTKITELHQIQSVVSNASDLVHQVTRKADEITAKMIADSTWPCSPHAYVCVSPDGKKRRRR